MDKGIFGSSTPKQLLYTLLYQQGLKFALRAAQEHRNLRWTTPQLRVMTDKDEHRFLRYTEDASKNRRGGIMEISVKPNIVDAYENLAEPEKCIIEVYEMYAIHCPKVKDN